MSTLLDTSGKSTPHIQPNGAPIADTILLPGDPLRAKFIADTYLQDAECFNTVRNMLGFTGTYRGAPVSVMGTGMGIPSIALYTWELIHIFGVQNLVRVGSCGALHDDLQLYDVVLAQGASTDSRYLEQFALPGAFAPLSSFRLLSAAKRIADERGQRTHVGNIVSSDTFYHADPRAARKWASMGVLAVEMEAAGLFANAAAAGVDALAVLTVSDHVFRDEQTSPAERETAFTQMMEIALGLI